jgi:hypothetical protein
MQLVRQLIKISRAKIPLYKCATKHPHLDISSPNMAISMWTSVTLLLLAAVAASVRFNSFVLWFATIIAITKCSD